MSEHPKLAAFTFIGSFISVLLWAILVDIGANGWFAIIPLLLGILADIIAIAHSDSLHADTQ